MKKQETENKQGFVNWLKNLPIVQKRLTILGGFFLSAYIAVVVNTQNAVSLSMPQPILTKILLTLFITGFVFYGIYILSGLKIQSRTVENNNKFFWQICFSTFCVLGIWMLAYYPGGVAVDTIVQWEQVQSGQYNDWHPVLHTLLFLWLPTRVLNTIFFPILVQCIYFSFSTAFLIHVLRRYGAPKWFYRLAYIYIIINPVTGMSLMYPLKDAAFLIFATILIGQVVCIYFTKGSWLNQKRNIVAIVSAIALATIMRHNALLLTISLAVWIGYMYRKQSKNAWLVLFFSLVAIFLIKIFLPIMVNYEKAGDRQAEILGLPMTILSSAVDKEPEKLSEETKSFLYKIAPQEAWEEYNQTGNWNTVKFKFNANPVVEEEGVKKILKYTLQTMHRAPQITFRAMAKLTDMVWSMEGEIDWQFRVAVVDNEHLIEYRGSEGIKSELENYIEMTQYSILKYTFWYIGVVILLYLFAAISRLPYYSWKKCIILVPILMYNFGTMLLLSGTDFRYFYFNFIYLFPVLYILMSDNDKIEKNKERLYEKRN